MGNPCLDLCSPGAMRSQQSAMHSYRTVRHRPRRRELRGTFTVDAAIYAQPLYVSGLNIGGGTHNVVYVATLNDSVYAIDADTYGPHSSKFTIYWSRTGSTSLIYDRPQRKQRNHEAGRFSGQLWVPVAAAPGIRVDPEVPHPHDAGKRLEREP